jgi:DnaJ-class molecular chaperone
MDEKKKCPVCKGTGTVPTIGGHKLCPACGGEGDQNA